MIVLVTGGRAEVVELLWRRMVDGIVRDAELGNVNAQIALGNYTTPRDDIADFVSRALTAWHRARPITRLIEGCASGIDAAARLWASENRIGDEASDRFSADWSPKPGRPTKRRRDGTPYNPAAGFERNATMRAELIKARDDGESVAILAFPGGKGTASMIKLGLDAGVPVWRCAFDDPTWRRDRGY